VGNEGGGLWWLLMGMVGAVLAEWPFLAPTFEM